jgi:3-oxoacyl-[acyl-carrier protein] reductase
MGALVAKGSKFKPGSVVVITGGSQGLGRSIALEYASRGCKVVVNARGEEAITEVIETCK